MILSSASEIAGKLIGRLSKVFNRSRKPITCMTATAPGMTLRFDGATFTLDTGVGKIEIAADGNLTLSQLATALIPYGVTCSIVSGYGSRYAVGVVPDAVDISSGGIFSFTESILWAEELIYGFELSDQRDRTRAAGKEAYLHLADGEWLNEWGGRFGVSRFVGANDRTYMEHIVAETIRPKSNNVAIEIVLEKILAGGISATVEDAALVSGNPPLHDGTELHDGTWLHNSGAVGVFYGYIHIRLVVPTADARTDADLRTLTTAIVGNAKAAGVKILTIDIDRV